MKLDISSKIRNFFVKITRTRGKYKSEQQLRLLTIVAAGRVYRAILRDKGNVDEEVYIMYGTTSERRLCSVFLYDRDFIPTPVLALK